ncbi:hypothetical protein BC940DRAFT_291146 [Gongronella butleri]|nr:hypothetical protein BC940DRAFT_291146 [Gongronella butleri]
MLLQSTRPLATGFLQRRMASTLVRALPAAASAASYLPAAQFAQTAFFSLDRPLLDMQSRDALFAPSFAVDTAMASFVPDEEETMTTSGGSSTSTTTITVNVKKVNGQFQIMPDQVPDQVFDYLVAMQEKWAQVDPLQQQQHTPNSSSPWQPKRRLARRRIIMMQRRKGFFEKN